MKFKRGTEETHNIYLEFNSTSEHMLHHTERSGASSSTTATVTTLAKVMKGVALLPASLMGGLMAGVLLLGAAVSQLSTLKPLLVTASPTSAEINVQSSGVSFPLGFELRPVEGDLPPNAQEGYLLFPEEALEKLGPAAVRGDITDDVVKLDFKGLDPRLSYVLLFWETDEQTQERKTRQEVLFLSQSRGGKGKSRGSGNSGGGKSGGKSSATATNKVTTQTALIDDATPTAPLNDEATPTAPLNDEATPTAPLEDATPTAAETTATPKPTTKATKKPTAKPTKKPTAKPTITASPTPTPITYTVSLNVENEKYGTVTVNGSSASSYTGNEGDTITLSWEFYDSLCSLEYDDGMPYVYDATDSEAGISVTPTGDYSCTFTLDTNVVADFPFTRDPELYKISLASGLPATLRLGDTTGTSLMAEEGDEIDIEIDELALGRAMIDWESFTNSGPGVYSDSIFTVGEGDDVISFELINPSAITVTVSPSGVGQVEVEGTYGPISPDPEDGKYYAYPYDGMINVTADAQSGDYYFYCFEVGSQKIYNNPYQFTPSGSVSINAVYKLPVTITVNASPSDLGDLCWVTNDDDVLVVTGDNIYTCPAGTIVTLVYDDSDDEYGFDHFEVNGSRYEGETYRVDADTTILGVFTERGSETCVITTYCDPSNGGTCVVTGDDVVSSGNEYTCVVDSSVEISAIPQGTYDFSHFVIGSQTITDNPYEYTVSQNTSVTAYFTPATPPATYTITTSVSPNSSVGSMSISGATGSGNTYTCEEGTTISMEADLIDETNYQFAYFLIDGDTKISENPSNYTVNGDTTIVAVFEEIPSSSDPLTLNVTASPTGWGTITSLSPGTTVYAGDHVSITCVATTGYKFVRWDYPSAKVVNPSPTVSDSGGTLSFNMGSEDVSVDAVFEAQSYGITVNYGADGSASGPSSATTGSTVTIEINPHVGYRYVMAVDGETCTGNTFTMPPHAVTVDVEFLLINYSITTSGNGVGDVVGSIPSTATMGSSVSFRLPHRDEGYTVSYTNKTTNDVYQLTPSIDGDDDVYSFTCPASDVEVNVARNWN